MVRVLLRRSKVLIFLSSPERVQNMEANETSDCSLPPQYLSYKQLFLHTTLHLVWATVFS